MNEKKFYSIYLLTCPDTNEPKYIGQSFNVNKRYKQHCRFADNASHTARCNWLRSLIKAGKVPRITVLESGLESYDEAEKRWVKFYRDLGYKLVNGTDGGYDLKHTQSAPRSNKMQGKRTNLSKYLSKLSNYCNGRDKYYAPGSIEKISKRREEVLLLCERYRQFKSYDLLEKMFDKIVLESRFRLCAVDLCSRSNVKSK